MDTSQIVNFKQVYYFRELRIRSLIQDLDTQIHTVTEKLSRKKSELLSQEEHLCMIRVESKKFCMQGLVKPSLVDVLHRDIKGLEHLIQQILVKVDELAKNLIELGVQKRQKQKDLYIAIKNQSKVDYLLDIIGAYENE